MAIADTINSMYENVGDIYDTLSLGGDSTQNKNIVNINSEIKREYKDFLANGTDTLWNNWLPKVNGTGESLTLNNTIKAKTDFVYKGNTSQNGEPTPDTPIPVNVVTGDNSIKVEGKNLNNGIDYKFYITGTGTQYKVSGNDAGLCIAIDGISSYTISTRITQTRYRVACSNLLPSTTSQDCYNGVVNDGTNNNITINTNGYKYLLVNATDLSAIQIEKGSTATEYEPYQSTTYPINLGSIELCKIGDYQDSIKKSSGKNLFDKLTITEGKYIHASGGLGTDTNALLSDYIEITPNTDYYISGRTTWNSVALYDSNKTYLERLSFESANTLINVSNTSCKYIRINASLVDKDTLMFNKGTTSLPYEPYGTGWYLKKEIGKYTFTGNENFSKSGYTTTDVFTMWWNTNSLNIDGGTNDGWCTFGKVRNRTDINNRTNGVTYNATTSTETVGTTFVRMQKTQITGWDESLSDSEKVNLVKAMLPNQYFYYILKNPTYEEITDTSLINQLEAIKYSYNNQTNITQTNDDKPFILDVTALGELEI